jgi:hypothetical protein
MLKPTKHEQQALVDASTAAGEFVERIGKTDLAQWSAEDWTSLIDITVTSFQDSMRKLHDEDYPF